MPFIGQVEDVNDPKGAHRVKVRCIGVHPAKKQGEDGVKTDELPWARVLMSTQFPQTSRIGAKHGLLAGSWVFGYFLDGEDCQDPMIVGVLTATAKSVGKFQKEDAKGRDGTLTQGDKPFDDLLASPDTQPNSALRTKDEPSKETKAPADPEGNAINMDHDLDAGNQSDGKKAMESLESYIRKNEENTDDTPQAQNTEVKQADALCGPEKHAQKDTESAVKRKIPPGKSRVQVDDVVYQRYTGKYLDMQGIMMQLTLELCNLMKSVLNSKRHLQNEKNREMIAKTVHNDGMDMDRDGKMIDEMDEKEQDMNDKFNSEFQENTIDKLCMMMMPMMNSMDKKKQEQQQQQQSGNQGQGQPNVSIGGGISDPSASCIAETIVNNVNVIGRHRYQSAASIRGGGVAGSGKEVGGAAPSCRLLAQVSEKKKEMHNSEGSKSSLSVTRNRVGRESIRQKKAARCSSWRQQAGQRAAESGRSSRRQGRGRRRRQWCRCLVVVPVVALVSSMDILQALPKVLLTMAPVAPTLVAQVHPTQTNSVTRPTLTQNPVRVTMVSPFPLVYHRTNPVPVTRTLGTVSLPLLSSLEEADNTIVRTNLDLR